MTMYVSDYCALCGHTSDDPKEFIIIEETTDQAICNDVAACARRQKRDKVLAEMQEMAKKPARNRTNDFMTGLVLMCGMFLGGVTAIALSWLFLVEH